MKIPKNIRERARARAVESVGLNRSRFRGEITLGAHVIRSEVRNAYLLGWEEGHVDPQLVKLLEEARDALYADLLSAGGWDEVKQNPVLRARDRLREDIHRYLKMLACTASDPSECDNIADTAESLRKKED